MAEHTVEHKGGFKFGLGLTCGLIAAICLFIALVVGGCLVIGGGCLAAGTAGASKVVSEIEKERKRQADEEANPDNWIDATSVPVRSGEVDVKVVSAKVIKVPLTNLGRSSESAEPHLVIAVDIANNSPDKKLDYAGWAAEFAIHGVATLEDDKGSRYKRVGFGIADVLGQVKSGESIYPGKTLSDVLVFEPPTQTAEWLKLRLPLDAFGNTGVLRVRIPVSAIQR